MRKTLSTLALLLLTSGSAHAAELSFAAVTGGELSLRGEIGLGNWITPSLYEQGLVPEEERLLESFTFFLTNPGTTSLTFRTAVGILEGTQLAGDAFTTPWQTISGTGEHTIQTEIPGGFFLDPSQLHILYLIPEGTLDDIYEWSIATTLTNNSLGVVGVSPLYYSTSHLVDLDLLQDRDVAMNARITAQVPEPSVLLLMAVGLFALAFLGRRKAL